MNHLGFHKFETNIWSAIMFSIHLLTEKYIKGRTSVDRMVAKDGQKLSTKPISLISTIRSIFLQILETLF